MTILEMTCMKSTKIGGMERFIIELIKESPNDKYFIQYEEFPNQTEYIDTIKSFGGEIIELKTFNISIREIFKYIKLLNQIKPDIIHFHFDVCSPILYLIAKLFGIKIIKTFHCCMYNPSKKDIHAKKDLSIKTRLKLIDGYGYKLINHITYVSNYCNQQMKNIFGKKITKGETLYIGTVGSTIHTDKNSLLKELNIGVEDIILTTTLFADPLKGLDILLNAIALLKTKNFVLLIIGMDESAYYTKQMKELCVQLNLSTHTKWIGITNDVNKYLSITDIYIQPSRTEALSLSAIEALSYGIPVIGSNTGGLPEVTDILFENENPSSLAEKITYLIENPQIRSKESCIAQKAFHKFNLHSNISKYINLYHLK